MENIHIKQINEKYVNLIFCLEKLRLQIKFLLNNATETKHSKVAIMANLNQKQ